MSFFDYLTPLWLFAFVYLISDGMLYVVRLNITLSFSFLASLGVCHMQNVEPGIQRLFDHVLLHRHMGHFFPSACHFGDIKSAQV